MKKFMTNIKTLAALLIAGAAMTACSSSDDNIANEQPVNPAAQKYIMTVNALKGDGDATRALTLDGSTLNASWATTENVYVKKGTNWVTGSLQPQTAGATANLTGVLSGTVIAAGDGLTLQFPKKSAITFEGQKGTIADIEANYDYATANVTVASVANGQISVDGTTTFQNHQAIIKFTLLDKADGTTKLDPSAFTISDGTNMVELTDIPDATYTTNGAGVLYVAFPATNSAETVTLTATVGSDTYTYTTSSTKTFTNGKYYAITVKMTKTPAAGQFSVSATKKVTFSSGNLQATWDGTSWNWHFAENQWDYIGGWHTGGSEPQTGNNFINGNGTVSADNVTVDLFGWVGASIICSGAAMYGINNSYNYEDYGERPGGEEALKSDWGNTIGSGWRTLTGDEWDYLLFQRTTTSNVLYAKATVNNVHGLILLPDDWSTSYAVLENPNTPTADFTSNVITSEDWSSKFAAHGCVFLPAAGHRDGVAVYDAEFGGEFGGCYWSSSAATRGTSQADNTNNAMCLYFYCWESGGWSEMKAEMRVFDRYHGCSVRLVRDVE